jgi:hypothetical protein
LGPGYEENLKMKERLGRYLWLWSYPSGHVCQDYGVPASPGARWLAEMRPLFTVIISPSHLAHSMDKRTRANGNGDSREHTLKKVKLHHRYEQKKSCIYIYF